MRLWGKVASGMLYLFGAIFLIVAVVVPEARRESIAVAVISIAVALFGIPRSCGCFRHSRVTRKFSPTESQAPRPLRP